jgi:hypothetical protein
MLLDKTPQLKDTVRQTGLKRKICVYRRLSSLKEIRTGLW